jgi:putative SOS response-associated peptidase YedK
MCGRYVSVARLAELKEKYKATGPGDGKELEPSHNVAPTNMVYAVLERRRDDGSGAEREIRAVRWGLLPDSAPLAGVTVRPAAGPTAESRPTFA